MTQTGSGYRVGAPVAMSIFHRRFAPRKRRNSKRWRQNSVTVARAGKPPLRSGHISADHLFLPRSGSAICTGNSPKLDQCSGLAHPRDLSGRPGRKRIADLGAADLIENIETRGQADVKAVDLNHGAEIETRLCQNGPDQ